MTNPFMDRAERGKGRHGTRAETNLARRLEGRPTPASGALEGAKGDIVQGSLLVESKSTEKFSLALKYEWLAKIANEATAQCKTPALAVQFVTDDGNPRRNGSWVMLREQDYKELTHEGG